MAKAEPSRFKAPFLKRMTLPDGGRGVAGGLRGVASMRKCLGDLLDQISSNQLVPRFSEMNAIGLQIAGAGTLERGRDPDHADSARFETVLEGGDVAFAHRTVDTAAGIVATGLKQHDPRAVWNARIETGEHLTRGVAGKTGVLDANVEPAGTQQALDDGGIGVVHADAMAGRVARAESDDVNGPRAL